MNEHLDNIMGLFTGFLICIFFFLLMISIIYLKKIIKGLYESFYSFLNRILFTLEQKDNENTY